MKGHANFRAVQLDNKFGIKDQAVIREGESMFTTLAAMKGMPDGEYDIDHLKSIHKHLLGDMYDWAGSFRSAELMVGNNYAKTSATAPMVEMECQRLLKSLRSERPGDMTSAELAVKMSGYYTKLYAISPFPDGNARTARFLIDKYCDDHEMQIKWEQVPAETFHAATEQALNGNHAPIQQIFKSMTDHKDLFEKYSTDQVTKKIQEIANQVGLREEHMPSMNLIGASQDDILKLAHYSSQVLSKDLEQYAKGGKTMRDWDATSIAHESNNTVKPGTSNREALATAMDRLRASADSPPPPRGPRM